MHYIECFRCWYCSFYSFFLIKHLPVHQMMLSTWRKVSTPRNFTPWSDISVTIGTCNFSLWTEKYKKRNKVIQLKNTMTYLNLISGSELMKYYILEHKLIPPVPLFLCQFPPTHLQVSQWKCLISPTPSLPPEIWALLKIEFRVGINTKMKYYKNEDSVIISFLLKWIRFLNRIISAKRFS